MPVVRILRVKKFDVVAKENNRKFNCKHVKLVMSAAGRGKVVYLTCDPPPLPPRLGQVAYSTQWQLLHNSGHAGPTSTVASMAYSGQSAVPWALGANPRLRPSHPNPGKQFAAADPVTRAAHPTLQAAGRTVSRA